jgi:hypothetical protein
MACSAALYIFGQLHMHILKSISAYVERVGRCRCRQVLCTCAHGTHLCTRV